MLNRPEHPLEARDSFHGAKTFTSNRGLELEEPLIFEIGRPETTGVDLDEPEPFESRLGVLERHSPIGLPGLSEPEAVRHYVRLSQKNYSIDAGLYPLGSCTMKHNPRLNEAMARLPGFADIHPLQPQSTVPGALELIGEVARWLMTLTGMPAIAMSPKAGAHGEACGMMAIKSAIAAKGEASTRKIVLVPESAHGTNPASATLIGFDVRPVPAGPDGRVDLQAFRALLGPEVAAIMLTNPNTCGLFESDIVEIADAMHAVGAYFYCDGANFNAIVGKARPGDLGVDAMHINLHKTFSTPHGGGGPGAGPVVLSRRLAPFAPAPFLRQEEGGLRLVEHTGGDSQSFGRMTAFHGQMGMFVRALSYMASHGADGLRQASEDAVLSANYIRASLNDLMSQPFGDAPCMHEVLFDDAWLKPTGLTTLDFAKAMIDEGYHPMTIYFPLVAHGAMLIEPTESESKASLDLFIATLRDLAQAALRGETERFIGAPIHAPRRRLDETRAARNPVLKWTKPAPK
ncbi:aminomethyl-transferring glycine dehydrogenase subunit GcvPB [Methylocella tundrae]|uniref:glycine dehydrogenase (aminomethyl-transferring) n=1 Tax=Methylocella tundrae TaxID=227605 RepID=A0A4U8YVV6_METTU|nr:aminomethyl-transferring glycine dehydrogenase subunit GcvPB [Methylocella tundrae]WPP05148.1 aminomethyl-transferring glycine dehydrogenase subunit GcvPB [Methylocella tundrae]VFU07474.1 putative glycine dehydrogenase (decarboxylating) subunit 2 [Methylocella tundrae]